MPGISANSCINSSHPSFGVPDRMSRLPPPDGPVKNVIFQAFIHLQDAPKQKPTLSITPVKKLQFFFCLSFSKRHPNQISNKLLQRSRAQNLWDRMLHGIRAPVRAFSAGMDNQSLGPSLKGRGFFLSSLSIKKQKKPPNCTHQCALQMSAASSPNSCTTKTHKNTLSTTAVLSSQITWIRCIESLGFVVFVSSYLSIPPGSFRGPSSPCRVGSTSVNQPKMGGLE